MINSALIQLFINDLCKNSSPAEGLHLSHEYFQLLVRVKEFNYKHIYNHPRLLYYRSYAKCIVDTIFHFLEGYYGPHLLDNVTADIAKFPTLMRYFRDWLVMYGNVAPDERTARRFENDVIYDMSKPLDYKRALIDYIAAMTDNFAIRVYHEIISF